MRGKGAMMQKNVTECRLQMQPDSKWWHVTVEQPNIKGLTWFFSVFMNTRTPTSGLNNKNEQ